MTDHRLTLEAAPSFGIQDLANELTIEIFSYLGISDISAVGSVCWQWHQLANDESLWRFFLKRDFKRLETNNPKEAYRNCRDFYPNLAQGIYTTRRIATCIEIENTASIYRNLLIGSKEDRKLVSGYMDGTIKVWDLESGVCEKTLVHHGSVEHLFLTKNGKLISESYHEKLNHSKIKIWDLENGVCEQVLKHPGILNSLIPTENGTLISGDWEGTIRVLDLATGDCTMTLESEPKNITSLCLIYIAQDKKLVSGSYDGMIRIWNLETGVCQMKIKAHKNRISCLILAPDGKLISGGWDERIKVWNLESGACEISMQSDQTALCLLIPAKEKKLMSVSLDGLIKIWNLETGNMEMTLREQRPGIDLITFTKEGELITFVSEGTTEIMDFTASNQNVLKELAMTFEENSQRDHRIAMQRFLKIPSKEKEEITCKLREIANPLPEENRIRVHPLQIAQAIRNYLNRESGTAKEKES